MTEASGVVDRIVDGETAVVLLESDSEVCDQLTVPVDELPEAGRHEGAVFDVSLVDGEPVAFSHRPDTERQRREAAQDRFDRLSKRLGEE